MFKRIFKRNADVYRMNLEQLEKLGCELHNTITVAQEQLSHVLAASEQLEFNIRFNREHYEKELGVKPAILFPSL